MNFSSEKVYLICTITFLGAVGGPQSVQHFSLRTEIVLHTSQKNTSAWFRHVLHLDDWFLSQLQELAG